MERIKISEHFYLDELVDVESYMNGTYLIDDKLIAVIELLREKVGKPLFINNWANGGKFQYGGFRGQNAKVGAKFSAHKKGMAADIKGVYPTVLLDIIEENAKEFYDVGLRRIEDISITPTWFHLDVWDKNKTKGIEVVNLTKVIRIIKL